jgi:hypothetical protein
MEFDDVSLRKTSWSLYIYMVIFVRDSQLAPAFAVNNPYYVWFRTREQIGL